jgi:hypothetical protein
VTVQQRLEGETVSALRTKVRLPTFVDELCVILHGLLGVEGLVAFIALEIVVVLRFQLFARPLAVHYQRRLSSELNAALVALVSSDSAVNCVQCYKTFLVVTEQHVLDTDARKQLS